MTPDGLTQIAVAVVASAMMAWLVTRAIWRRATHLGLIDTPNERSSHVVPTPRGGGVGFIVSGLAAVAWLVARGHDGHTIDAALLSIVLALIGLLDDRRSLPAVAKLAAQTIVCAAFVYSMDGGLLEQALLVAVGVWWINLFNFMDGIDGIAGAQGVFMLGVALAIGVWAGPPVIHDVVWVWMAIVAAGVCGFLWHNWPPARIFMGDAGSNWLAFVLFVLALLSVRGGWLTYTAWLVLGATFVTDATVTLVHRMLSGERWFAPHRTHAYQRLAIRWQSHRAVTLLVAAINIVWLAPLAVAAMWRPSWAAIWLVAAYAPLAAAVIALRFRNRTAPAAP